MNEYTYRVEHTLSLAHSTICWALATAVTEAVDQLVKLRSYLIEIDQEFAGAPNAERERELDAESENAHEHHSLLSDELGELLHVFQQIGADVPMARQAINSALDRLESVDQVDIQNERIRLVRKIGAQA
jgi:hypothetical protein